MGKKRGCGLSATFLALLQLLACATVQGQEAKKDKEALLAAYRQGEALTKQGKYAEAIKEYEKVVALADKVYGPDDPNTATLLNNLADLYQEQGLLARAERLYLRSLKIWEDKLGKDHPEVATGLSGLAGLYREQGKYEKAEPLYLRSLQILETRLGKDHAAVGPILNNLALLYKEQGQYGKAEPLYQRSLRIGEITFGKDHPQVAVYLNNLAGLYEAQALYGKAEPLFQRSLQIYEARFGKDHPDVATGLNNLALLYQAQGPYSKAEQLYQRSLQIREARLGKDHPDVAASLHNLATLYEEQGLFARAEPLYQRSLLIWESNLGKDHPDVALSLNNLANLYTAQGQFGKAEPLYERSVQIREEKLGKDHPAVATSLDNLARLRQNQGRYKEAELLHQRSLRIVESTFGKDHPDMAPSLYNLAMLYQRQGHYARAEPLYQRCLLILEGSLGKDHPDVARNLNNLAVLYQAQGDYAKARPLYERSLQIGERTLGKDHPHVATSLTNLAGLHAASRRWSEARLTFESALQSQRRHLHRNLHALAPSEQLLFLQNKVTDDRQVALSLALQRRADAAIPAQSAAWLLNAKALSEEAMAEPLVLARDAHRPELRGLFQELLDVRHRLARLHLSIPPPGQEKQRREQLAELAQQEQHLSRKLSQEAGREITEEPWIEVEAVRQKLPPNTVLVELAHFYTIDFQARGTEKKYLAPRYAAWVIPARGRSEVQLIDLGEADRIEQAVRAVRQGLQQSVAAIHQEGEADAEAQLRQHLERLSSLVLKPLLPYLARAENWLVSPDAALWLVPWEALLLADGSYVIEKHRLSYLVSGRDLVKSVSRIKSSGALVLADPDFELAPAQAQTETARLTKESPLSLTLRDQTSAEQLGRFGRLPGTAAEAAVMAPRLKTLLHEEPITVRTGKEALEGVFKSARSPRVLVLSTHGFFLRDQVVKPSDRPGDEARTVLTEEGKPLENPLLRCGLALAGANRRSGTSEGEDGILTGLEILGTDLRGTELVVLSACETGLGQVNVGEGVAGLRQAFQLAGARSVLASLWQVDDRETARLMSAFFDHLARGKSKADALREAQLAIIKARRERDGAAHPFFWAAFTLTGAAQ